VPAETKKAQREREATAEAGVGPDAGGDAPTHSLTI